LSCEVLGFPAGQASVSFNAPFSELELENFLLKVNASGEAGGIELSVCIINRPPATNQNFARVINGPQSPPMRLHPDSKRGLHFDSTLATAIRGNKLKITAGPSRPVAKLRIH